MVAEAAARRREQENMDRIFHAPTTLRTAVRPRTKENAKLLFHPWTHRNTKRDILRKESDRGTCGGVLLLGERQV
jgi:hypothetical protein